MSDFKMSKMHWRLLAGSAAIALTFVAAPALAQDATETSASAQTEEDDDIITVTAQKRAENVQDVPSSVSVISGQELENSGATSISDFAGFVPSFVAPSGGVPGRTTLIMRGITTGEGSSTTVGVVLDDVPVNSSTSYLAGGVNSFDLLPYDIERVEVLLGPQGTLYGASSMGGLLKYVTVRPDLEEVEIRAGGELSSIRRSDDLSWGVRGAVSVPIVKGQLALRVSGYNQETAGFLDNPILGLEGVNDTRQTGGRAVLLWEPSDNFSIQLAALTQKVVANTRTTVAIDRFGSNEPVLGPFDRMNIVPERNRQKSDIFTAIINWDFGAANLTSISSYSKNNTHLPLDFTANAPPAVLQNFFPTVPDDALVLAEVDLSLRKYTQEVRVASPSGGKLEWMLGGFYTHEKGLNAQPVTLLNADLNPNPVINPLLSVGLPSKYEEIAVFANATYRFSEAFDLSAGLRWAENHQTFSTELDGLLVGIIVPPAGITTGKSSEDVVTFMVSPQYHVTNDIMLYARVASGYRPGGPNVPLPGLAEQFDADTLINYELGLKSQFWNRRATVNLSVYRIDWDDIQLNVEVNGNSGVANGGKARSQGVELTSLFEPVDGLQLGINGSYTDAKLIDPVPSLNGFAGDQLPNVPKWQGSASVDYSFPVGSWTGSVGGRARYIGKRNNGFPADFGNAVPLESYTLVDLNAALETEHWTARLFVRNLFDEYALTSGGGALAGIRYAPLLRPRTVGIAFDVRF